MRDVEEEEEEEEVKPDEKMGQFSSFFFFFFFDCLGFAFYQTRPKSWQQRGGLGKKTTS